MNKIHCTICDNRTTSHQQIVRSGEYLSVQKCSSCEFEFFNIDPRESLADDSLYKTRLGSIGLEIPDISNDFANGLKQSKDHVKY